MFCKQHRGRLFVGRVGIRSRESACVMHTTFTTFSATPADHSLCSARRIELHCCTNSHYKTSTYCEICWDKQKTYLLHLHMIFYQVLSFCIKYISKGIKCCPYYDHWQCSRSLCITTHTSWKEVNETGFQSRTLRPDSAAQVLSPLWGCVLATEAFWKMVGPG